MSNKTPIRVTGTFTPSGTQDVNIISPIPLEVISKAVTSTVTRVNSSTSSIILLAANTVREGLILYNHSTATQYVKFGTTATATDFTLVLTPRMTYEMPNPIYVGRIDVISSSTNGAIQVTELT
jgi:hypothetical protein